LAFYPRFQKIVHISVLEVSDLYNASCVSLLSDEQRRDMIEQSKDILHGL
jgi:hypothetical protein